MTRSEDEDGFELLPIGGGRRSDQGSCEHRSLHLHQARLFHERKIVLQVPVVGDPPVGDPQVVDRDEVDRLTAAF